MQGARRARTKVSFIRLHKLPAGMLAIPRFMFPVGVDFAGGGDRTEVAKNLMGVFAWALNRVKLISANKRQLLLKKSKPG